MSVDKRFNVIHVCGGKMWLGCIYIGLHTLHYSHQYFHYLCLHVYTIWNWKWNRGHCASINLKGGYWGGASIQHEILGLSLPLTSFDPSDVLCTLVFDVQPRSECHFVNRGRSAVSAQAFDTSWRQLPLLGEALIIERKIWVVKAQMCRCLSAEMCGDITHCKATVLAVPCHQAAAIWSSFTLVPRADGSCSLFYSFIMNE